MKKIMEQLERYIEDALVLHDLPGLAVSVGVGKKGSQALKGLNLKKAVGVKDVTSQEPLEPDHIFHMASVSKLFTSAGILRLCEEGALNLDDRLMDVLPFVSIADKRYGEIKIHHMLTHTSGMADVEEYRWDMPKTDETALKGYAVSDEVKNSHMFWSPHENKFHYSNMAYELLGLVIAERTGQTYEDYMKREVLQPLGMERSTFLTFERAGGSLRLEDLSQAHMAMPHAKDEEKRIVLERHYPYNREHGPSSTLTSCLEDLDKWARAHLDQRFFSPTTYQKLWKRYAVVPNNGESMGLGWFLRSQQGYEIYGHEGTDDGFRASFWICPRLDAHVIVVANISGGAVKTINKKLFQMLIRSV